MVAAEHHKRRAFLMELDGAYSTFSIQCRTHSDDDRSRRLFSTTLTLLNAIAALAMIGDSSHPVMGNSTPAATGTPTTL